MEWAVARCLGLAGVLAAAWLSCPLPDDDFRGLWEDTVLTELESLTGWPSAVFTPFDSVSRLAIACSDEP